MSDDGEVEDDELDHDANGDDHGNESYDFGDGDDSVGNVCED